ncbi:hypothetical protein ABIE26_002787 [Pedobacter africanus]|uniref:Uncharacterized protein n=1 Tax=Pedobacter africanus TaxID=151894 RepID=A0ACC6KXH3_9SPHI|nr:hypothetical protein [Pedobacter africanus]MDR6783824.1 hypothetical protein [Pedobacter africanus]
MKKLLIVLFLSFACSTIYAQVRETNGGQPTYANGDSYGYYVDNVPGAVSYEWFVQGSGQTVLFPAGDRFLDIIFYDPGAYDIICVVTKSDYTEVINYLYLIVDEE